ncbi:hypothetical protein IJS77_03325 [bacterium]|nr:hypothetical protein [bacterium]
MKIFYRATKSLVEGLIHCQNPKKFLLMKGYNDSIGRNVKVPLSCFSRTKNGEIILYRGLQNDTLIQKTSDTAYNLSNAASRGFSLSECFRNFNLQRTRKGIQRLFDIFVAFSRDVDPILHTTTSRKTAISFAGSGGILIEYHIPPNLLKKTGYVTHLGENEISFLYKIPKKCVKKVTKLPEISLFGSIKKGSVSSLADDWIV